MGMSALIVVRRVQIFVRLVLIVKLVVHHAKMVYFYKILQKELVTQFVLTLNSSLKIWRITNVLKIVKII